MSKKIVIINGHPNPNSFNFGIAAAYQEGAQLSGAEVRKITIADLVFDPNLKLATKNAWNWNLIYYKLGRISNGPTT